MQNQLTNMKPLSEVTKDDAIAILSVAYNFFHVPQAWKLTDETAEIKEPCKKFRSPGRAYQFWFFDNNIDVEPEDDPNKPVDLFDCTNYDVKLACYVKAYELGYNIPAFSRFTTTAGEIDYWKKKSELQEEVINAWSELEYVRAISRGNLTRITQVNNNKLIPAQNALLEFLQSSVEQGAFYCREWYDNGSICDEQCDKCLRATNMPEAKLQSPAAQDVKSECKHDWEYIGATNSEYCNKCKTSRDA